MNADDKYSIKSSVWIIAIVCGTYFSSTTIKACIAAPETVRVNHDCTELTDAQQKTRLAFYKACLEEAHPGHCSNVIAEMFCKFVYFDPKTKQIITKERPSDKHGETYNVSADIHSPLMCAQEQ